MTDPSEENFDDPTHPSRWRKELPIESEEPDEGSKPPKDPAPDTSPKTSEDRAPSSLRASRSR